MNVDEIMALVYEYGLREREDGSSTRAPRSPDADAAYGDVENAIKALVPDPNRLTLPPILAMDREITKEDTKR